jgi:ABC-type nickel/cobalt efflux system permease component RcnA
MQYIVSLSLTATSMTATSSSTMSASEPQGSSTNTGTIVGGVVGGVGGALIIVAAIWFLMRHRRSQVAAKGSDTNHHYAQPGYHSDTGPDHHHDVPQQEVMGSTRHPQELSGNNSGAKSFSELS